MDDFTCNAGAANDSNGLKQVAATPPIMEVLKKLRLEKVVIVFIFKNKHTKTNHFTLK
jgi:hypothetical protein